MRRNRARYSRITEATSIVGQTPVDPTNPPRELIKPGVTIQIQGAQVATTWSPSSLAFSHDTATGNDLVTFTDRDELDRLSQDRSGADPPPSWSTELDWSAADSTLTGMPRLLSLPLLGFAGPHSDDPGLAGTGTAVCQLADLDVRGKFPGDVDQIQLAAAWVKLRMHPSVRAGDDVGNTIPRLPGWSGALVLVGYADPGSQPWMISLDVPDVFNPVDRALAPPRMSVVFTLRAGVLQDVSLYLAESRITVETVPVELYSSATPLPDPESVPYWPLPNPEQAITRAALVFRDLNDDALGDDAGLCLSPNTTVFEGEGIGARLGVRCQLGVVQAFVPAQRAFIDPAAPGLPNVPAGALDQSHGLVPIALTPDRNSKGLRIPGALIRPFRARAVWEGNAVALPDTPPPATSPDALPLALLPWSAAPPRPFGSAPTKDEELAVYHRNLGLEPAEFAAAASDRAPAGQLVSPTPLPRSSVVAAVRDRYTLATDNANTQAGGALEDWLPNVQLYRAGAPANLALALAPEPGFPFNNPEIHLLSGTTDLKQVLSLATDCSFLAFDVAWKPGTGTPAAPATVTLSDPKSADPALNSAVPLLFEDGVPVNQTRASLDNLGVVRPRADSETASGWHVAERIVGDKLYLAVTYYNPNAPLVVLGTKAAGNLTEIDLA